MPDDITIHQDTTLNAGKFALVLPIAGVVLLLSAGVLWGTVQANVSTLQEDVRVLRIEVQSRESKDAVALMFGDVRARLTRIEALLDRPSLR